MKRLLSLFFLAATLSTQAAETVSIAATPEPAHLVIWNREIAQFRANIGNLSPTQRRDNTLSRMRGVSDYLLYSKVRAERSNFGNIEGVAFMIGDQMLFTLIEADLDHATGQTLAQASEETLRKLENLRTAKLQQRNFPVILRGIGVSALATFIFIVLIKCMRWLGRKLRRLVSRRTAKIGKLKVREFDMRPLMIQTLGRVFMLVGWLSVLGGAYLWIVTILAQFPYTSPWGNVLGMQIRELIAEIFGNLIGALPGLLAVVIIFTITRWVARVANHLIREFERDGDNSSWLSFDAARATRRIVIVLIWVFGVIIAYPYIPGSESPAFKGISVFAGLVLSLGSTGLVNQMMSGFVVLYSGAVRTGEYARIGDTEGIIQEIGFLSTKLLTPRREYITVPNAVLISKETMNYSRLKENDQRTEIYTKVTIGYDAPWRQVHAMLLLAAERSPGIRRQPQPRVLQSDLSDFYVQYELRFVPAEVTRKGIILSDLHQNIQDIFNEFGVQIMSPNFVAQPNEKVQSPKNNWFLAPAKPSNSNKENPLS